MIQRVSREKDLTMWCLLALAFVFRVWLLDIKPPHFDEGINGFFVSQMWSDGYYKYDPTNFHGPLYFYILQMAELLFGHGIWGFRFVNALISVGIVAIVYLHRRFVGKAAVWAALLIAVSPGFVFYSRYAIHESLFVLAQVLFSYGFFLWRERPTRRSLAWMILGFVIAVTTKETFFIFFITWAIGIAVVRFSPKFFPAVEQRPAEKGDLNQTDVVGLSIAGIFAILFLFTGFLMHMKGAGDMFTAFAAWTKTGTVESIGHNKPFGYWLTLFVHYEWAFLVGLIFSPIAYYFGNRNQRLLAVVGFGTWLAYSLIPYKTPWLLLNFLWLLAFSFGVLVIKGEELLPAISKRLKSLPSLIAVALVMSSVYLSGRLNFYHYVDASEPYVYVQSTNEFKAVMDVIENELRLHPEVLNAHVLAMNSDTWPLPWTLVHFTHLVWGKTTGDKITGAGIVLIDDSDRAVIEKKLRGKFWLMPFQIRDAYQKGWAYFDYDMFKNVIPAGTAIFENKTEVLP